MTTTVLSSQTQFKIDMVLAYAIYPPVTMPASSCPRTLEALILNVLKMIPFFTGDTLDREQSHDTEVPMKWRVHTSYSSHFVGFQMLISKSLLCTVKLTHIHQGDSYTIVVLTIWSAKYVLINVYNPPPFMTHYYIHSMTGFHLTAQSMYCLLVVLSPLFPQICTGRHSRKLL